jgi:hypothetical protein
MCMYVGRLYVTFTVQAKYEICSTNFQVRHLRCVVENYIYIVKHISINDFIKAHFLHCFLKRHVSALVMSHFRLITRGC